MKDMTRAIIGGLTLVGVVVAGYRTYELRKLRKEIQGGKYHRYRA